MPGEATRPARRRGPPRRGPRDAWHAKETLRQIYRIQSRKLAVEACELRGHGRFFSSDKQAAPSHVAAHIEVDGQGSLSLRRARATFVCAHIRAGTPLDVLNEIAGPISGAYLQQMLAYCAGSVDPMDAANRGLAA